MQVHEGDIVVITGASSGLGADAAQRLGAGGYRVLAGYRDIADAPKLNAMDGVEAIRMDVTEPATLQAAAARARAAGGRVGAVVVNAGVAVGGPIELVPLEALRTQFEVNVIGAVATIQAFLPDVRVGRGRVILMSSVSGRRSAPVLGPYAASKYALEALGDALRMETARDGVEVVVLEPGGVKTPIWEKGRQGGDTAIASASPADVDRYRDMIDAARGVSNRVDERGLEPSAVSDLIQRVLKARRPRTRYPLGERVGLQTRLLVRILGDRVFDRLRLRAMGISRR